MGIHLGRLATLTVVAALAQGTLAAHAADVQRPVTAAAPLPSGWTVTIGAELGATPSFLGSKNYEFNGMPVIDVRRAGTPRQFRSPRDGFGVAIIDNNQLRIGPVGNFVMPRWQKDDNALRGLGNVDFAFEFGAFAEYWWAPWLRTRGEIRQGVGGHGGLTGDLFADVVVPVTQGLTFSAGPRVSFATATALSPYFSITPDQSFNSGLPVYNVKGGLKSYGAGAQIRYDWSAQFATYIFVEYERLTDSVANSPLVRRRGDPNQTGVGVGITYAFDIPDLW